MPVIVNSTTPVKEKDEWRTPPELFGLLDSEFIFQLDAAATPENALCDYFYTKEEDALGRSWRGLRVFCNPPFSKAGDFLRKGIEEFKKGATCVFLLRADGVETKWWRDNLLKENNVYNADSQELYESRFQIRFLTPRVNYLKPVGTRQIGVKFPSAVVVMRPTWAPNVFWWSWKKELEVAKKV